VVSYLHTHNGDRAVDVGDHVVAGQQIALVGNEPPSGGCHLGSRVNAAATTNPTIAALGTHPEVPGYVHPEAFLRAYGLELCASEYRTRLAGS
jgi:murein DD-endopeptidase MepM/ murein hydrolase activator NlpD